MIAVIGGPGSREARPHAPCWKQEQTSGHWCVIPMRARPSR